SMDIVALCKRQYMHKDLLDDRYGRFWEIPAALAARGHTVRGFALSYQPKAEGPFRYGDSDGVQWESMNAGSVKPLGLWRYMRQVSAAISAAPPDVILACSDSLYVIVGAWLQRRHGGVLIADLYDNFEAYDAARLPMVRTLFRRALRGADGVTVISERLKEKVCADSGTHHPVNVLVNGIPQGMFQPLDKKTCRRKWHIPEDALVMGCSGILTRERGYEFLLEAYRALRLEMPGLQLALAGSRGPGVEVPQTDGIHDLGVLPQAELSQMLACLDLAVICNRRTAFSEYTFPQRMYETLACGVPLLASNVGAAPDVLKGFENCLYEAGDQDDFVKKARALLKNPEVPAVRVRTWPNLAAELEQFIQHCVAQKTQVTQDNR
ncbi:MAG: glycosyltransferase family 4 protein, partial [Candidatus Omnitrophica bacterium]|nr:glycosyltransferase family 4 protein [Candidatus Omnitrophota bacterium]